MSMSQCDYGMNGCEAVQELQKKSIQLYTVYDNQNQKINEYRDNSCREREKIWNAIDGIRGLVIKGLISIGVLTAAIQGIFKIIP